MTDATWKPWQQVRVGSKVQFRSGPGATGRVLRIRRRTRGYKVPMSPHDNVTVRWDSTGSTSRTSRMNLMLAE